MFKKISILGSTGSIGLTTLDIIDKKKKDLKVIFLSADNTFATNCLHHCHFGNPNAVI